MPEHLMPVVLMFGLLGAVALWSLGSLCWELARAQEHCHERRDEEAYWVVRRTGAVAGWVSIGYYAAMGATCVTVAHHLDDPSGWVSLGLMLGIVHQHYLSQVELRLQAYLRQRTARPPARAVSAAPESR